MTYDLIVPSASRPHLLAPTLQSILTYVDLPPARLLVHDDAAFPGRQAAVVEVIAQIGKTFNLPTVVGLHDPPVRHGPALHWLLSRTDTEFVLYAQDDGRVLRSLPIRAALSVMRDHDLHQIRFNKRPTMGAKPGFVKREYQFAMPDGSVTLTTADHWYFQLGLWRVARIRPIVDWWMTYSDAFNEHCEIKVNRAMNREVADINGLVEHGPPDSPWRQYALPATAAEAMDPDVRARVQRTFIWGPIGEDKFFQVLGTDAADWALPRPRGGHGPIGVDTQASER